MCHLTMKNFSEVYVGHGVGYAEEDFKIAWSKILSYLFTMKAHIEACLGTAKTFDLLLRTFIPKTSL